MSVIERFHAVLKKAVEVDASDVHVSAGGPFRLRLRGKIVSVTGVPPLEPADTWLIAREVLVGAKRATPESVEGVLQDLREADCSYSVPGVGRFRVNVCSQRGSLAAVLRHIPMTAPNFEQLGLPEVLEDITM
ncbi:MAG: hypothetical protein JNJ80_12275, partial [Gemmatimonadetes bacterium]|nr:hypothetical protein [Gemmatimonadota bacterium]